MSDDLERIFLKVRSKYSLPGGILPDPDGLAKVLHMSARSIPLDTFKGQAELILQVLKKSTNECLRNGFIQAMSCNDVQTAQTCLKMLENRSNFQSESISQTENPSGSNLNSFGAGRMNRSSVSENPAQNKNYRPSASVSLVKAVSNLDINPLSVIVEKEEKSDSDSNVSGYVDNQGETSKLATCQTSPDKNERGKKHRYSQLSKQITNVGSESEQEASPEGHINSKPVLSETSEEDQFLILNKVDQRSDSEDSEIVFKPSLNKNSSLQNKSYRKEANYDLVNSNKKDNFHSDSEAALKTSSQRKPARKNKKTINDPVPRSPKSQSKLTVKASKKEINKPASKTKTQTKALNNSGKYDVRSTTNRRKKKGKAQENFPSSSKIVSEPSKLNTQGSVKRGETLNKKTSTISPAAKDKQKPSSSTANKKTTDKLSAARSKTTRKKSKSASDAESAAKKKSENIKTIGKENLAKKPKENVKIVSHSKGTIGYESKCKDDEENTKVFGQPPIRLFLSASGDILTDIDRVPINLDHQSIVKRIRGG